MVKCLILQTIQLDRNVLMIKNSLGIKETALQQVNDYAKGKDITMATINEVYLYMTIGYKD